MFFEDENVPLVLGGLIRQCNVQIVKFRDGDL